MKENIPSAVSKSPLRQARHIRGAASSAAGPNHVVRQGCQLLRERCVTNDDSMSYLEESQRSH